MQSGQKGVSMKVEIGEKSGNCADSTTKHRMIWQQRWESFEADRDRKITEIIARIGAFGIKGRSDDHWVEECVQGRSQMG